MNVAPTRARVAPRVSAPRFIHPPRSRPLAVIVAAVLLIAFGGGAPSKAHGAEEPTFGKAIALSPYEVRANSLKFEHWTKLGSPNFVLYTDARPKEGRAVLQQLEMLHIAAQGALGRRALVAPPPIVVLPRASSDWHKLESKGEVQWKAAISRPASRIRELIVASYNWQDEGLYLLWAALGSAEMDRLGIECSFSVERGIGFFFETAQFSENTVRIGRADARALILRQRGWLPWDRFFAITNESPEYTQDTHIVRQFHGQCAAFVQYMLTNQDPVWTARLLVWNAMLCAGRPPTEQLFQKTCGQDWKQWQETMDDYLRSGEYLVKTFRFPPEAIEFPISEVDLQPNEIRELFVLVQILNQRIPDSLTSLKTLLERGVTSSSLRELLAEACFAWELRSDALPLLKKEIAEGSKNPETYFGAAMLLWGDHTPPLSIERRLAAEDAAAIREWCERALHLEPLHPDVNELLAMAIAAAPDIEADDLESIRRICHTLSGNGRTDAALAALAIAAERLGQADLARRASSLLLESYFARDWTQSIANAVCARLERPETHANHADQVSEITSLETRHDSTRNGKPDAP